MTLRWRGLPVVALMLGLAGGCPTRTISYPDGGAAGTAGQSSGGSAGQSAGRSGNGGTPASAGAGGNSTGGAAGISPTGGAGGGAGGAGTGGAGGTGMSTGGRGGTAGNGGGAGAVNSGGTGGAAVSCASTQHNCENVCFDKTSIQACGTSCVACQPPANATATCDGTACGFKCNSATQHACNGACVDNTSVQSCGTTSCQACPQVAGATATCDGTKCGYTCAGSTPHDCGGGVCVASAQCCSNADCPTNSGGQTGTCDTGTHACNYNCPSTGNSRSCTVNGTTTCISPSGCCIDSDCTGTCKVCNSSHVCVAATNEDDPNGRCGGTCDSTGACVSKKGQLCNATTAGCISGTQCAPDGYCCDSLCAGPCVACDFQGKQGTCTPLPANSTAPHSGHGSCNGAGTTCGGRCDGSGSCTYPTAQCGTAFCSGTSAYTPQGTCNMGTCEQSAEACTGNFVCSAGACKTSCVADADCLSGYYCGAGTCHLAATSIACGEFVGCAILSDGTARCWGENASGELGTGTATTVTPYGISAPVKVNLAGSIAAIGTGTSFACAMKKDGSIWCWGFNGNGQLGNGSTSGTPIYTPVMVTMLNSTAKILAVGQSHTCALLNDGSVQCWGLNGNGQLGNGTYTQSPTPVTVPLVGMVLALQSTADSSYALIQSGGPKQLATWGLNGYGQLGVDSITSASPYGINSPVNADVSPLALATSDFGFFNCTLSSVGSPYCFGQGFTATPTVVSGWSGTAVQLSVGGQACAVMSGSSGAVTCWTGSTSPATVNLPGAAIQVASGEAFSCALLKNGSVTCWGDNTYGQLGNGTFITSSTPVPVQGW